MAAPAQEIETRETGATVEALRTQKQRGKTHRARGPNKHPITPNGGGGSYNHKRTHKKQCFNNGTSKSLFNNSPVCVESQHTRVRVGARSVYQERNERKKKTRRAREKERKKKRKEERKKGIKKKEEI